MIPIHFKPLIDLNQLGVPRESITFQNLTLNEKWICAREPSTSNVTIIDLTNPQQIDKRPIKSDASIMNPIEKTIALRITTNGVNNLMIFKLVPPQPVKVAACSVNDPVEFWKWISPTMIGIVTSKAVLHWDLRTAGTEPVAVFQRHQSLLNHRIMNYHVNHDMTWAALVGLTQEGGRLIGHIQLYNVTSSTSKTLDGHSVAFSKTAAGATIFAYVSRNTPDAKLFIGEVSSGSFRVQSPVAFPDNAPTDFPVSLEISEKFKVVYVLTKEGYFHMYDLKTGKRIYANRLGVDVIFTATSHSISGGLIYVNQSGQVCAVTVNDQTIIPFIAQMNDLPLAISVAGSANIAGTEPLVQQHFQQLFAQGQYAEAAKIAAESPNGFLRTPNTINVFKNLPVQPGQQSPLLAYFACLLDRGTLNENETLELARPVLQQGRKEYIEKWLASDQLFCSENLGDLVRQVDLPLAIKIYEKAGAKAKVVTVYAEVGQYDTLVNYCRKEGYQPNWMQLFQAVIATNPGAAVIFAKMLLSASEGPLLDINSIIDVFMSRQLVKETTALLLDVLAANRPEEGPLQTRLFEINLKYAPVVAEAIFDQKMFTHYDHAKVAALAQAAGLTHRALQHTKDINEIKKLLVGARNLSNNASFIIAFFGTRTVSETLDCLRELLRADSRTHLDLVVAVGVKYTPLPTTEPDPEQLDPSRMIALFEEFHSWAGMYLYLKQIVSLHKTNKFVVFKFIQSAASLPQPEMQSIEMAVRDFEYEPEKVRDFLKELRLPDQLPLVLVCDKFNFIPELTSYLFKNSMYHFIEAYVEKINPMNTPIVVGTLLDLGCDEEKIHTLLNNVGHLCPVDSLVDEVEKRGKLRMLRNWLEARVQEGNKESATHNARAKILILSNDERKEQFLLQNEHYNPLVVGKFCESHDAYLAYVAYRRGKCHNELISVTNRHGLFKQQAKYLVEEQDAALWASVLSPENEYRRQVIDEVVQHALPETKRADLVSNTVRAFMTAELPNELIELLDKIVLQGTEEEFRKNRNLQNLLLLTAIKSDKSRVMDYIHQLDCFDAPEIAEIAIENELFEEAFSIYRKAKLNVKAIQVLITWIKKIDRAAEFADACSSLPDGKDVHAALGAAQLDEGLVSEAINSLIIAEDPTIHERVVDAAKKANELKGLSKYLIMCRKKLRNEKIDSELCYTYAKLNLLPNLDELINSPNIARIQEVGDVCFSEGLYEAARMLFHNIGNHSKLASTYVKLKQFSLAIDAAKKANSIRTWIEINHACVEEGDWRFDKLSGIHVILHPDELENLCNFYEMRGHASELITLLETGLGMERAHNGLFTELAIVYSKYKPGKLMEHLRYWKKNLSVRKVCDVCRNNRQWPEVVLLYEADNDYEKAARVMMEHSVDAWDDHAFRDLMLKVSQIELYYEAIKFYIDQHPDLIVELLNALTAKLDPAKVVEKVLKMNHIALIKKYLTGVQEKNILQVNEALNDLYIEEEDYESLRQSIEGFNNFDSIALAKKLDKSELIEFRKIGARLYRQNKKWKQSIEISLKFHLYKDAMDTAQMSGDREIAEELLQTLVEVSPSCFAACLYTCYDLIRPDFALELAWRNQMIDFVFPFLIQILREYTSKVDHLVEEEKRNAEKAAEVSAAPPVPPVYQSVPPPGMAFYPPPGMVLPPGINAPGMGVGPGMGMPPPGMAVPPPGMVVPGMGMPPPGMGVPPPGMGVPPPGMGVPPPGFAPVPGGALVPSGVPTGPSSVAPPPGFADASAFGFF